MQVISNILSQLGYTQVALIVLALSIFIDVNPKIKFNPLKCVISFIGKAFNNSIEKEISGFKTEVNAKFEDLQKEQKAQRETLNKLVSDQENREICALRWDVIDFENSIANGVKHTREQYRHILDSAKKYLRLVETSENIEVEQENIQKIKESAEAIRKHYEAGRIDQSILFF